MLTPSLALTRVSLHRPLRCGVIQAARRSIVTQAGDERWGDGGALARQAVVMFTASAVLGPLCDGQHSAHNVLHYAEPSLLSLGPFGVLETCWWVPLLFGVAGVLIGVGVPVLDEVMQPSGTDGARRPVTAVAPSWPAVLLCISAFVAQYAMSGALEAPLLGQSLQLPLPLSGDGAAAPGHGLPALDALLGAYALGHWLLFDRTVPGAVMSSLTALGGPLIEVVLINGLHLYHYEHPAWMGIPTFLPAVYFCGGPAVGNLGRRVWQELKGSARPSTPA